MFESLGFENFTAPQVTVFFALAIGVAFGLLAERSKFCFRRGLVGEDRKAAMGVWLMALSVAVAGTQFAVFKGFISFEEHRFMASDLPVLSIIVGGSLFGAGMVLTRGCASRLTVLIGSGNLRAVMTMLVFAITAHATMKGVLAPIRSAIASVSLPFQGGQIPGNPLIISAIIIVIAGALALRSGNSARRLLIAATLGALVPLAWVGTGFILFDDFDPIPMESLSFTLPASETLFFAIVASAISANFGTGLFAGVILGGLLAAIIFRNFQWQSFENPAQTGRYLLGGAMMGMGGVLAGGCTVGAGLSGIPTLSIAAVIALLTTAASALLTNHLLNASAPESAVPSTTQQPQLAT